VWFTSLFWAPKIPGKFSSPPSSLETIVCPIRANFSTAGREVPKPLWGPWGPQKIQPFCPGGGNFFYPPLAPPAYPERPQPSNSPCPFKYPRGFPPQLTGRKPKKGAPTRGPPKWCTATQENVNPRPPPNSLPMPC